MGEVFDESQWELSSSGMCDYFTSLCGVEPTVFFYSFDLILDLEV